MKFTQLFLAFFLFSGILSAQNLHAKLYVAPLRTVYKAKIFDKNTNGGVGGLRLAFGLDRYQIGVEMEGGISTPTFTVEEDAERAGYQVENSFQGIFLRANFSSVPIYRLGVIAKIGAGYFSNQVKRELNGGIDFQLDYPDRILGYNVGIGVSGPIRRWFHWDFMYQVNYHQRPVLVFDSILIEQHHAWQHAFQLGVSLNLAFGKTKERADNMIRGRGY